MRRPKYKLTEEIEKNDIKFAAGTEIQVFWNDHYVPEHYKKELEDAARYNYYKVNNYYMCLIGRTWVVLAENQFREER